MDAIRPQSFTVSQPQTGGEVRAIPWVTRASNWLIAAIALLCAMAVWLLSASLDVLATTHNTLTVGAMLTVDVVIAVAFGVLVLRILIAERTRHLRMARSLTAVAEMNHHIRNALERINLATHVGATPDTLQHVRESSSRIEWALRELLPRTGDEEDERRAANPSFPPTSVHAPMRHRLRHPSGANSA